MRRSRCGTPLPPSPTDLVKCTEPATRGSWLEVVVQAPFYVLALYAFVRRQNWIKLPSLVYATVLLTIMPSALRTTRRTRRLATVKRRLSKKFGKRRANCKSRSGTPQ